MAIEDGDKVTIEYEGKLESGEVFDTSKHKEHSHPLEFEIGSGKVIPGFEKQVKGMEKDEEKEFTLKPSEAYGEANPELIREIPKTALPKDQEPKKGMFLMMNTPDGKQFPARISEIKKDKIMVDLNHPLAGKNLIFNIKVTDIKKEKKEK